MKEYNENLHNNAKGSTYENAKFLREFKTKAEDKLWEKLRNRQLNYLKFRRQHPFGEYVLDFYCHEIKLCVEVDGNIHNDKLIIENDNERTKVLNDNGINVLRFKNQEIIDDINKVLKKIVEFSNIPLSKRRGVRGEVMNRIDKLFSGKKKDILNVYCTAGFPNLQDTLTVLHSLQKHGADMVELGMPYSDPLADGPVIQQSSMIALQNGMTIQKLFEQIKDVRKEINVPLILMGYMNPVLQYGFEKFCEQASAAGIDGLILPDLPMYEFETEYGSVIKKFGLDFIFLITPETSEDRIRKIDQLSKGFIYAVSSSSTTGSNKEIDQQENYFLKLHKMNLKNPVLVGFGIKDRQTFLAACKYTNGAIIGTAYIKALQNFRPDGSVGRAADIESTTQQFLNDILR